MKLLSVFSMFLFIVLSCQTENAKFSLSSDEEIELESPRTAKAEFDDKQQTAQSDSNKELNRQSKLKIIKTGSMSFDVKSNQRAKHRIDSLLAQVDGYYSRDVFSRGTYESKYNLTIRLPSENFELFINQLEAGNGKLLSKKIQARDVTEEYMDLTLRLKNKQEYVKTYLALLNKSGTIEEMLSVQNRIRVLEEEIDAAEGRIRYLNDRVGYSTLDLTLIEQHEVVQVASAPSLLTRVKTSADIGYQGFIGFMLAIIALWPLFLLVPLGYFVVKRIFRKKTLV